MKLFFSLTQQFPKCSSQSFIRSLGGKQSSPWKIGIDRSCARRLASESEVGSRGQYSLFLLFGAYPAWKTPQDCSGLSNSATPCAGARGWESRFPRLLPGSRSKNENFKKEKVHLKNLHPPSPSILLKTFVVKLPVFGSVKTFSRQALYVFWKNKRVTEIYFQNSEFVLGPVINMLL